MFISLAKMQRIPYCFILFSVLFFACKKEDDITNDSSVRLIFSEDTILFDTVFTSIGSVTEYLLVYNNEGSAVNISSIRLAKGNSSSYRLNVDGSPGKSFSNVVIGPNDSLWIFIEVTIDPNNQSTPFLLIDSILFETNGNLQDVDLVAFGQNAHFFIPNNSIGGLQYSLIPCNTVWDSILPYVIYGYAVVDSGCQLIINEGVKVYFYQNSGLWVYANGNLQVNGTLDHPVIFQGTRLEQAYADIPGQWDRIWINEGSTSPDNIINYAVIKNGFIGIQTEDLPPVIGENQRKLVLSNTIIKNMSGWGLFSRFYRVDGYNNVIANCQNSSVWLSYGGEYDFNQCTFANYWNQGQRSYPCVYINNYATDATGNIPIDLTKAEFKNCIVYGSIDNELVLDFITGAQSNHKFSWTLLKVDGNTPTTDVSHFESIYANSNPSFVSINENNYELDSSSFAINKGNMSFILPGLTDKDLKGKFRNVLPAPDLGAYENQ